MHEKINDLRKDIVKLTTDCADVWTPQMELDSLTNHRTMLKLVKKRSKGEPWQGSLTPADPYVEVDNFFRRIKKPQYYEVLSAKAPILLPPALNETGIDLLDKILRDMTGMVYSHSHFLAHGADTLTKATTPCWTCLRAATRQLRKYQEQFRKQKSNMLTGK